jgi:hypothetical protein
LKDLLLELMVDCPEIELKYISVGILRSAILSVSEKDLLLEYTVFK